ncbi:hypothetical protein F4677DRAFT_461914 [Hypoxylon crocopeplum]|nr:hypothetical protein F4677DRAFT_461914 [Hypoxylon crocopeplum]
MVIFYPSVVSLALIVSISVRHARAWPSSGGLGIRQLDQPQVCPGQQVPVDYFVYPQFVLAPAAGCPNTPGSCDADGCAGKYAPNQDNKPQCTAGKLLGCACTPTDNTCAVGDNGELTNCKDNNCEGQFVAGSTKVAQCTKNMKDCQCLATDGVCPQPFACEMSGCEGTADDWNWHASNGDDRTGRCQSGNLKGCSCIPTPGLTPGYCAADLRCDKPGANCDKGSGQCGDGPYKGCSCQSECYVCGISMNDLDNNSWYCQCTADGLPDVYLNTKDGPEAEQRANTYCDNQGTYCL